MKTVIKSLKARTEHVVFFVRWLAYASGIGLMTGLVGVAFHHSVKLAGELRVEFPWLLWLLPVGGILIALSYQLGGVAQDRGTNLVLCAVRDNEKISTVVAPLIFIGTVITHLVGGSAGREGAALQLGGSIASSVGRRLKLDGSSLRILVVCGMSGCFSAIFGTPISAAIFAMEVVHVGVMHYSSFFPAIISSLVGLQVAALLGGERTAFTMTGIPELSVLTVTKVIILGILLALLSIVFYETIHAASRLYQKYIPNLYLRAAAGGALVIVLTLLVGNHEYNGTGMASIISAIGGTARPEAFALKLLFTAVTLGAGFKGGEIIPVFFSGATFGCVVGPLIGLPASFSAGLGLTALFCGVTNCPVTSVLLAFELFGGGGLPLFVLCSAVSYVLSGYGGLYYEQKIVFSKFKPEYYEEHYKGKIYVP